MVIKTLGALRSLISGKPDCTPIVADLGPDLGDVIEDALATAIGGMEFSAAFETRCDGVERLYVQVDGQTLEDEEEGEDAL